MNDRPQSDADYYRKRAIQEQVAAQKATCPTARELHDELAAMYRFRVSMLSDPWSEAGVAIALQRLTIEQGSSGCMQPSERRASLSTCSGSAGLLP